MLRFIRITTVTIIILSILSCKKNDKEAPELTINSPIENANFSAIDTIQITGNVSDNFNVKSVSVIIADLYMKEVTEMQTFEINKKKTDLNLTYFINQINLQSGSYYIIITAIDDNLNEKKKYFKISISGIKTDQKGVYVCAGSGSNIEICIIDSTNNIVPIFTINESYKDMIVNSYNQQLSFLSRTGELKTYSLPENDLAWEKSNLNGTTSLYYSKLNIIHNITFVGSNNNYIYGYNKAGVSSQTLYYNSTGFLPSVFNRVDDIVCTYLFSSNTQKGRIEKINYETGSSLYTYEMDFSSVIGFFKYDTDVAIVFGNHNNTAKVCTLGVSNNSISIIDNFSTEEIQSVVQVNDNEFYLAIGNKIYLYKVSNPGLIEFKSNITARKLIFNEFNNQLYVILDNSIRVYKVNGSFVTEYNYNKKIYDVDFLYNKSLDL